MLDASMQPQLWLLGVRLGAVPGLPAVATAFGRTQAVHSPRISPPACGCSLLASRAAEAAQELRVAQCEQLSAKLPGAAGNFLTTVCGPVSSPLRARLRDVRLWSPEHPHLYDVNVRLVGPGEAGSCLELGQQLWRQVSLPACQGVHQLVACKWLVCAACGAQSSPTCTTWTSGWQELKTREAARRLASSCGSR